MKNKQYIIILSLLCAAFVAHRGETAAPDFTPQPPVCLLESADNIDSPAETTEAFSFASSDISRLCTSGRRGNNSQRHTTPEITAGSLIPRSLLTRYFHICKPLTRQHYNSGTVLSRICVLII